MQHGAFPLVKPDPELLAIRSAFQLLPQNLVVRVVKIQAADTVTPVIPVRIGVKSGAQAAPFAGFSFFPCKVPTLSCCSLFSIGKFPS